MNHAAKLNGRRILGLFRSSLDISVRLIETLKGPFPQSKEKIFNDAANFWRRGKSLPSLRDHSHWKGEGRWAEERRWEEWGKWNYGLSKNFYLLSGNGREIKSMVEWGPGGGANAVWFCREVSIYYGVDISEVNLSECQRQVKSCGFEGFRPVLVDIVHPEKSLSSICSPVDFFLSTAVFQHFPSQDYGWKVVQIAHKMLAEEGVALIQIRYDDGSKRFKPKHRDYERNVISFNSFKIHEFWKKVGEIGFTPLAIFLDPRVSYAYYCLQKSRTNHCISTLP